MVQDALCPAMAGAGWKASGTQGRLPGVNSIRQTVNNQWSSITNLDGLILKPGLFLSLIFALLFHFTFNLDILN